MGWLGRTAIGAVGEVRCLPAVCATAHFLAAFGLTAFWYGHGSKVVKVDRSDP